ncbi:MAG: putative FmdB family regulatory protein [Chlamydiales bacterium]|jgi:putative FmdB family regulatory protein
MPTYDYKCDGCGAEMEIFHSMTQSAKRKCPECGKLKLVRQIGAGAGFLFKGSGFYETDYRSKSYQDGKKADEKAKETPKKAKADKPKKSESKGEKS